MKYVEHTDRTTRLFWRLIGFLLLLAVVVGVASMFTDEEGYQDNVATVEGFYATVVAPKPTDEPTPTAEPTDTPEPTHTSTPTESPIPRITRVTATPSSTPGVTLEIAATKDLGLPEFGVVTNVETPVPTAIFTSVVSTEEESGSSDALVTITLVLAFVLLLVMAVALSQ